jgi:hypothetical protein
MICPDCSPNVSFLFGTAKHDQRTASASACALRLAFPVWRCFSLCLDVTLGLQLSTPQFQLLLKQFLLLERTKKKSFSLVLEKK